MVRSSPPATPPPTTRVPGEDDDDPAPSYDPAELARARAERDALLIGPEGIFRDVLVVPSEDGDL